MTTLTVPIQWRRNTAAQWVADNSVLLVGEAGYESDTGLFKLGDGTTAWNSRPYANAGAGATLADIAAAQRVTINPQSGTSYTLVLTDANKAVEMSNAAANTVTVPPNSSVAFTVGDVIEIAQVGAGQTTVAAGAGVTINASTTLKTRAQWSSLAVRKRATDSWLLTGDAI